MPDRKSKLEMLCAEKGLKMTDQRRIIAACCRSRPTIPMSKPAQAGDTGRSHISIATVYRTVRLFEEAGILAKHDFGDGRARYEETPEEHHDHLIDIQSARWWNFTTTRSKICSGASLKKPDIASLVIAWSFMAYLWTANPTAKNEWTRPGRPDNGRMIGAAPLRMSHAH
jgi:Fur family ferric uptake transcriptional regulator